MARTKGAKNKVKEAGNPAFNIAQVEPSSTIGSAVAASAVMPEDLEFDRELERLSKMEELPPDIELGPKVSVVAEKPTREMLGDIMEEYSPASTDQELKEQIHTAKMHGCDSIEATLTTAKRFCKDPTLETVGYFIMSDIKVYVEGAFDKAKARDRQTIEQRTFGGSTVA